MLFFGHTLCPEATPLSVHKMTKAVRTIKKSKEHQYISCKAVFVTVKPEQDTKPLLSEFKELFGKELIICTEKSNKSDNLVRMMRFFKVPVGLCQSEISAAQTYFENEI